MQESHLSSRAVTCEIRVRCHTAAPVISFFFFFQAEDGIRDYKVTGVQTCALPISLVAQLGQRGHAGQRLQALGGAHGQGLELARSEERRVGKECRSRWSPYH